MTAFSKFDPRNRILEILRDINLSIGAFSRLQIETSLPRWTVERILNGDRIDQSQTASLLKLAQELKGLQDNSVAPLNFNDPAAIKQCLLLQKVGAQTIDCGTFGEERAT